MFLDIFFRKAFPSWCSPPLYKLNVSKMQVFMYLTFFLINVDHILQEPSKEEFSDWPHGLLAIGTFGTKEEPERCNLQGSEASCPDHLHYITPEEVGELQKELKLILDKHLVESSSKNELETHNLQLESIFNSSSRLEIDRNAGDKVSDDILKKDGPLQCSNSAVLSRRGKDSGTPDSTNNVIGKKSLSFLLQKMFLSRIEFAPAPSLRDSLPESRLEKSRMKKMFRAVLNKKIFPQSCSPKATTAKICLHNKQYCTTDSDDEMFEEANNGSKWVKTDSEFIVLEI